MPLLISIDLDVIMPLSWFRWRIVFHDFLHEWVDSGADLVEFKALDDPGVGYTIEGLLLVVVMMMLMMMMMMMIIIIIMKCGRYSHSKGFWSLLGIPFWNFLRIEQKRACHFEGVC